MSHADIEMPDGAIVARLAGVLREAQDLADLIVIRPHLSGAASAHLQLVILGATSAHEAAEGAAIKDDGDVIHRARMLQDYIWTYGGGVFYPQDPKAEEVNLTAIAQSLSLKCRWTGHPKRLYSVGEHSLHVAEIAVFLVESLPDVSPEQVAVHALLHDAGKEAYLPDVSRPVANYLDASLGAMAVACQEAVLQALNLPLPTPAVEAVVRDADTMALRLEAEVLFPHEDHDPDAEGCNLQNIVVPLEVREQFPVWDGDEAPTCESIRDQWETTLVAAIEMMREQRVPKEFQGEPEAWEDAAKKVEVPETCMVCAVEGKTVLAESNGLCGACLNA